MIAALVVLAVFALWLAASVSENSKASARRSELATTRRARDEERWRRLQAREETAIGRWLRSLE